MAAPDIDKLQEEQQNFIIEQEKPAVVRGDGGAGVRGYEGAEVRGNGLDDLTLDDITATPREKTREEIIAEAEAAAFAEANEN